jgi:hypothetical protein
MRIHVFIAVAMAAGARCRSFPLCHDCCTSTFIELIVIGCSDHLQVFAGENAWGKYGTCEGGRDLAFGVVIYSAGLACYL